MPRTQRSVLPFELQVRTTEQRIEIASAQVSAGSLDFGHALFAPMHYAPGYAYPLIVWLHGHGADERQLQRIMPLVSMQNFVAVAPRGLDGIADSPAKPQGYGWSQADEHVQLAEQRVFDGIELASQKFNIAPRRIFLAGFDTGGTMALRLAMSHPNRFAGVVSMCGPLPTGGMIFGNLIAARRLGYFMASGRDSQQYSAVQVCEDLRLMHTAGLSITLRQYPCGQQLDPQMLADLNRWVMEQILPPSSFASDTPGSCEDA